MSWADAYVGRRVLVTGHTGFKGSWMALWLKDLGAEVTGFALPPPTEPSHFEVCRLGEHIHHIEGDIRDFDRMRWVIEETRPEIVFHLAAQAIVLESYENPRETFETNVSGTVNVLEAIRKVGGVRAAVMITSDKCYENREWDYAYRESDHLGGHDPYSASKGAAELVISAYRRSFFDAASGGATTALASVRAGNVIGGGDWAANRLLPDCARALRAGEPVTVRNPRSVRPWQHVLEPLAGYLLLGARLLESAEQRYTDAFNFGPESMQEITVGELVQLFLDTWGEGEAVFEGAQGTAQHEAGLLKLSCEKAHRVMKWQPVLSAAEAVAWTVEWYRAWHEQTQRSGRVDMTATTHAQIRQYAARLSAFFD